MSESEAQAERSVVLKMDWDVPVNLPLPGEKSRGHFAGRRNELASLANEIERRWNGAILIAGHRGVGKTSLVHRAVVQAQQKDARVLAVLINAAQLNTPAQISNGSDNSIDSKALVEHLIRRLYATARSMKAAHDVQGQGQAAAGRTEKNGSKTLLALPEPTYAKIEELYRKAVAQEFKLKESLTRVGNTSDERVQEQSMEQSVKLEQLVYVGCAVLLCLIAFLIPSRFDWLSNLLPLGVAIGGYAGTAVIRSSRKKISTISATASADQLYQFDNKLGNLEFDLETVQRELRDEGWKLVYIIDELDKLEEGKAKAILSVCKNFFTLSDAIFIFVGDEKSYEIGRENSGVLYQRAREYTYFGSRYYLAPPTTTDLREFLCEIIERPNLSDEDLDAFRFCVCFEAYNDYCDLLNVIRGRITKFQGGVPVIEIGPTGLSPQDVQKSRFERCITSLYEGRYMSKSPRCWQENARLLKALFSKAKDLVEDTAPRGVSEPQDPPRQQNQRPKIDPENALIRDFYRLLLRVGAFTTTSPQTHHGAASQYYYTGGIPYDPPLLLDERTEFEQAFLKVAEKYMCRVVSVYNVWCTAFRKPLLTVGEFRANPQPVITEFKKWNWNPHPTVSSFIPIFDQLRGLPPYEKNRDEIVSATNNLESEFRAIYPQLPLIFASMILHACVSKPQSMAPFRGEAWLLKDSEPMRQAFASDRPQIVYSDKQPHQVVLICGALDKLTSLMRSQSIPGNLRVLCFTDYSFNNDFDHKLWLVHSDDEERFVTEGAAALNNAMHFLESGAEKLSVAMA